MDPADRWLIPLRDAAGLETARIGGKARRLAQLAEAGFRTPGGFCIPTDAYRAFVARNQLAGVVQMELGRKPMEEMRWEEIWDAALRIRQAFLAAPIPDALATAVTQALAELPAQTRFAVRSSATSEDAAGHSFAGLHESRVDLAGGDAVLDAVRVVWASLWSDAALLYRRELSLDPVASAMAVLVQPMLAARPSGVAFGRDPRAPERDEAIVEAVPGACGDLVDGSVDPDRFTLARPGGALIAWQPGSRDEEGGSEPLLGASDLATLMRTLLEVEALFGWPPDLEWTDRDTALALLQARPVAHRGESAADPEGDDRRAWYLSLRPGAAELSRLCDRVEHTLIPELARESERLAAEDLDACDDSALADAIDERREAFAHWSQVYWDEFIPLAHGVRRLGSYYDEAVRPRDPYAFVGLLQGEPLAASERNGRILELAARVRGSEALRAALEEMADAEPEAQREALARLAVEDQGRAFVASCEALLSGALDVCYDGERLSDRMDLLLRLVRALAQKAPPEAAGGDAEPATAGADAAELEQRLLDAVGPARHDEAREVLRIGRTSWRLRDDDNLLLGRVESQLLRAIGVGLARLRRADRLHGDPPVRVALASLVADALRDPGERIEIDPGRAPERASAEAPDGSSPRQLVGQPAGPGFAEGRARRIRGAEDLGRFRDGEILVCDAIQPSMTHLVPLSAAIVERRGGMLIHGAIIARELGIPCVNGVASAVEQVRDGDWLIVDGDLGLVTVGRPEFDLEARG